MPYMFLSLGFFILALGVILGAFGAHGLENSLSETQFTIFKTAVDYQYYAGIWIVLMGLIRLPKKNMGLSNSPLYLCILGWLLFSGSLYTYLIFHSTILVMITPIGGVLLFSSLLLETWVNYKNR